MSSIGKKAGVLALFGVFATALLGSAYTLWYEDVQLDVVAATGELDGAIYCGGIGDNEGPWSVQLPPASFYPPADPLKDVADPITIDESDEDNFVLNLSNVYPGYMADCEVHILNTGTVPWHIEMQSIVVLVGDDVILEGDCEAPNQFSQGICWAGDISPTDPDGDPLYVQFNDVRGCQVHGPSGQKVGSLFLGVNQSALEDTEYTVLLKFRLHQWNESYWHNCGDPRSTNPGNPPEFPN